MGQNYKSLAPVLKIVSNKRTWCGRCHICSQHQVEEDSTLTIRSSLCLLLLRVPASQSHLSPLKFCRLPVTLPPSEHSDTLKGHVPALISPLWTAGVLLFNDLYQQIGNTEECRKCLPGSDQCVSVLALWGAHTDLAAIQGLLSSWCPTQQL